MIGVKRSSEKYDSSPAQLGARIGVKKVKDTPPLDPSPSGPALEQNRATQFDSSRNWAEGGEGSSLTQGMSNYKPHGGCATEGGMS